MEFFQNIWNWLTEHGKEILTFLTSAEVTGIILMVINLFRSHKAIKLNTSSSNSLKVALDDNNLMRKDVNEVKEKQLLLEAKVDKLIELEQDNQFNTMLVMKKVNTMLDVQSVVYSTIKDDTIRESVNNLLLNAKYNDSEVKSNIQNQLNDLKTKIKNMSEGIEEIKDSANKVEEQVVRPVVEEVQEQASRY